MRLPVALSRRFPGAIAFSEALLTRFHEERCLQLAGSLSYTTILAVVPLFTVALALSTAFPVFSQWTGRLDDWLADNVLPENIADAITFYVGEFSAKAGRLTAAGIAALALAAVFLMLTIDRGVNKIFRVERQRPLVQRLLIYWAVLTLGPLLMGASVTVTSYFVSVSLGYAAGMPGLGAVILKAVPWLLTCAGATILYLLVPNRHVRFRDALIGGVIAGILFELAKRVFAFYIQQFPTYTLVYGTFAAIPIFLVWMYTCWLVVLFGATVVAVRMPATEKK